jgi:hypothetical protein
MPESVPLSYRAIQRRAPEPLEEAVEKCVVDVFDFAIRAYGPDFCAVNVTRADVSEDLLLPAIVVRAARLRESIPTGDVYEVQVGITMMTLMDQDDDISPATPAEFCDNLWAACVALIEDPQLLLILQNSRSSVTWRGLVRQSGMEFARQDRHTTRTYRFNVHVSRLA